MAKTVVLTAFWFFSTISVAQDLECDCGIKKESIVGKFLDFGYES